MFKVITSNRPFVHLSPSVMMRSTNAHTHTHTHTVSGVYEGHHDVSGPSGGGQTLVVVRQAAGVHEGPALPGRLHLTVVPQEPAASALQPSVHQSILINDWKQYR